MADPLRVATTPWDWQAATNVEVLCEQAATAQSMGFHSFWLPENHFAGRQSIPAPLLLLAAVAARTTSIKLGCISYLLPIRNALLAAEEVAVLDQLSGGRLILGLTHLIVRSGLRGIPVDEQLDSHQQLLELTRSAPFNRY